MIKRIKFRTTNNGSLNTTQKSKIKQHEPHEKSVGAPEGRENSLKVALKCQKSIISTKIEVLCPIKLV
jgi:hypothetical protein